MGLEKVLTIVRTYESLIRVGKADFGAHHAPIHRRFSEKALPSVAAQEIVINGSNMICSSCSFARVNV
jgi:hypothetical protein